MKFIILIRKVASFTKDFFHSYCCQCKVKKYLILNFFFQQKTGGGTSKRIVYGSTTLTNAKQFLKQLSLLGQEH